MPTPERMLVAGHGVALAEQGAALLLDPTGDSWEPDALAVSLAGLVMDGSG